MSYRIKNGEGPGHAIRRIAGEQVARALAEIRDPELTIDFRVHQLRRRCKKIRAAVRLVRPGFAEYAESNAHFRDMARRLASHRDARMMAELAQQVSGAEQHSDVLRWYWTNCEFAEADARGVLIEIEASLIAAATEIERWDVDGINREHVVGGLALTLDRARSCYTRLVNAPDTPPVRLFHDWRKRCKYHHMHLTILKKRLSEEGKARRDQFVAVDSLIGDAHDCSVLLEHMATAPPYISEQAEASELAAATEARRRKFRRNALQEATSLFDEDPVTTAELLVPKPL